MLEVISVRYLRVGVNRIFFFRNFCLKRNEEIVSAYFPDKIYLVLEIPTKTDIQVKKKYLGRREGGLKLLWLA